MDGRQSKHLARVRHLRETFAEANEHLANRLRAAADDEAEGANGAAWSAAQIGWHVAAVNTRFAALLAGDVPAAKPLEHGFVERPWAEVAAAIPAKLQAGAAAQPRGPVTRRDAIAALEASAVKMARAFDTLTPERGAGTGVTNPMVGTVNLYQVGEWAVSHVWRHDVQVERALADAPTRVPADGQARPSG
ncbi:MAG TPA: DinB family protein [Thermoanaerobaculia bacterium]|nr:DinB family protein [Thermoanaerobaculia bacterium]